jgi:hypothetical protein
MAKPAVVAAAGLFAIATLAGCGGGTKTSTETIHIVNSRVACDGPTMTSTNVVLKDANGKIVGTGKATKTPSPPNTSICDMTATLDKVPASDFYSVELDNGKKLVTANSSDIKNNVIRIIVADEGARIGTCEQESKDGKLHYDSTDHLC